jgi:hypothetical protein
MTGCWCKLVTMQAESGALARPGMLSIGLVLISTIVAVALGAREHRPPVEPALRIPTQIKHKCLRRTLDDLKREQERLRQELDRARARAHRVLIANESANP